MSSRTPCISSSAATSDDIEMKQLVNRRETVDEECRVHQEQRMLCVDVDAEERAVSVQPRSPAPVARG